MWSRAFIFLLGFFVLACSEDSAPEPFPVTASVFFEGPSVIEVKESDEDLIEIPIKLSFAQEGQLSISYDVIGEEVINGSDFEVMSANPILIPDGSTSATISIKINNNAVVQPEERKIFIRFRSTSPSEVQIKTPKEVVISIQEDDCPESSPNTEIWVGPLLMQDEVITSDGIGSVDIVEICEGFLKVEAIVFNEQNPTSTFLIRLAQTSDGSSEGTASVIRFKLFSSSSQFEYEASGTYNEISKSIILNYSLFNLSNSASNITGTHLISVN